MYFSEPAVWRRVGSLVAAAITAWIKCRRPVHPAVDGAGASQAMDGISRANLSPKALAPPINSQLAAIISDRPQELDDDAQAEIMEENLEHVLERIAYLLGGWAELNCRPQIKRRGAELPNV